ncbi:MAG: GNAT family protein [Pseudomonadota bacterium]
MTDPRPLGPPVPGWTARARPPHEIIEGRFARLEPLDPQRHGADLFTAFTADPSGAAWTYRLEEPVADKAAFDGWLAAISTKDDMIYFAYVDAATGRAAGNGAFMSIAEGAGAIEIGSIMIAPPLARSRAGTEALVLMIRWAFEAGYRRLEWTCDPLNKASMAAAERLGFTYEALFRAAYVTKGRNRDKAIFAIIDEDWPALDAAYRTWLSDDNFDAAGAQRARLRDLTAAHAHAIAPPARSDRLNALGQEIGPAVDGWTPPPQPPRTPHEGRYVRLEPLDPARHAEALFAANGGDAAMFDYLFEAPFADAGAYRDWTEDAATREDQHFHAIVDLADGAAKGVASYLRIAPAAGSIEVGNIAYSPALQRTRAGTEAMYLFMKRAFELGYRRYEWKCNHLNAPSRRLALRLGMSFEGVFRQAIIVKGRNRDTSWYAVTRDEWPALQAAFETWLDPSNFDADGRQKTSLTKLTRPLLSRIG